MINNLINNAYKFTNEGGVTLRVKHVDDEIIVEVKDTGIGITEADMEYIFEPYTQLLTKKRRAGGLGLGLSISKNLIEAHDGRIWVESEKDKGSSFFFSIPVGKADLEW